MDYWVARDEDGELWLFRNNPELDESQLWQGTEDGA